MPRDVPARDVMTTEVVTFAPDEPITVAMQRLVDNGVDAGPGRRRRRQGGGHALHGRPDRPGVPAPLPHGDQHPRRPHRAAGQQEALRARAGAGRGGRCRGRHVRRAGHLRARRHRRGGRHPHARQRRLAGPRGRGRPPGRASSPAATSCAPSSAPAPRGRPGSHATHLGRSRPRRGGPQRGPAGRTGCAGRGLCGREGRRLRPRRRPGGRGPRSTPGRAWLAVALVEEAVALREAGIDAPILLLSEARPERVRRRAAALDLRATVYSPVGVAAAAAAAAGPRCASTSRSTPACTGSGRPATTWSPSLGPSSSTPRLELEAVLTHCAVADEPDRPVHRRAARTASTPSSPSCRRPASRSP